MRVPSRLVFASARIVLRDPARGLAIAKDAKRQAKTYCQLLLLDHFRAQSSQMGSIALQVIHLTAPRVRIRLLLLASRPVCNHELTAHTATSSGHRVKVAWNVEHIDRAPLAAFNVLKPRMMNTDDENICAPFFIICARSFFVHFPSCEPFPWTQSLP